MKNQAPLVGETRIPFSRESGHEGYLRPVPGQPGPALDDDAKRITDWRNRSRESFFTWTDFDVDHTRGWLLQVYGKANDYILFMAETKSGGPFGHLAFSKINLAGRSAEVGRILRGNKEAPPGSMKAALATGMDWIFRLGIEHLSLEVFENNQRAIQLYEDCGFRIQEQFPLYRHDNGKTVTWKKTPPTTGRIARGVLGMVAETNHLNHGQGDAS